MGCLAAKVRRAYGTKLWRVREPLSDAIMGSMLANSEKKGISASYGRAKSGLADGFMGASLALATALSHSWQRSRARYGRP
jgi:hypothetical protein